MCSLLPSIPPSRALSLLPIPPSPASSPSTFCAVAAVAISPSSASVQPLLLYSTVIRQEIQEEVGDDANGGDNANGRDDANGKITFLNISETVHKRSRSLLQDNNTHLDLFPVHCISSLYREIGLTLPILDGDTLVIIGQAEEAN